MELTFLGTGISQGIPIIACDCYVCKSDDKKDKRLRSSVLINVKDKSFIIDSGPDFRYQMLRAGIKRINALLFTHEHRDHTAGLDDIRALNWINKERVKVYAEKRVQKFLRQSFTYVFEGKYPGLPDIDFYDIDGSPLNIEGIKIIPIRVMHNKLPVFGFRFGNITYITDAKTISEEELKKIKGSKILILNALRRKPHVSHFSLDEAVELAQKINAEKTFLTHIGHHLGRHNEVEKELPSNIFLAYDKLNIRV